MFTVQNEQRFNLSTNKMANKRSNIQYTTARWKDSGECTEKKPYTIIDMRIYKKIKK